MKLWKRGSAILLALVLVLSLSVPALAADAAAEQAACTAASYSAQYSGAESVQYAVWYKGETVLTGHVGSYSRTENRALTDDILYGAGSVSKMYTTVAVMQLAEAGKLSLDAPVTRYLKDFKMADERYKQITVRMLLNHSSGLMGSTMDSGMLFDDPDRSATEDLLERLSTQRLKADPGAYSVYCNDGFTLAELVVEAVSGKSFPEYLHQYILAPAGLEHTFAPGDSFDKSLLAKTYRGTDDRPLPADCLGTVGTGGLYASASDLAAFGGALTGTKLLRQSSLDAMAAPEYAKGIWPKDDLDAMAYGLGWDNVTWYPFCQSGITALVKGGDTLYYHAGLVVLPEYDMAAAVVSSGGASTFNEMAASQMLIALLAEQGVTVDQSIPALPEAQSAAMPAELTAMSGWYGATTAQYRVDVDENGTLVLHCLNYPTLVPDQTFTYHGDGTFRDVTGTAYLSFVTEENGETYLYQKAVSPVPGLGALPVSNYAAVRLPENAVTAEAQAAWDKAMAMSFLPMNEKYTSEVYLALSDAVGGETPETVPGYVGVARIVDGRTALYAVQLPGAGGRDGRDMTLYEQNGAAWLRTGNSLYMAEEAAPDIFTGGGWSYSTVQEDGFARWYHVGGAAGQTMTVQVPENGSFWVYDGNGQVTASSVLWDDTSATLPQGGFIVFAGDAGVRFHLRFQ